MHPATNRDPGTKYSVFIRRLGDYLLAVGLPDDPRWPSPDDEAELSALFDALIATDPQLAAMARVAEEDL
jgi:hypothetical protein